MTSRRRQFRRWRDTPVRRTGWVWAQNIGLLIIGVGVVFLVFAALHA
jgi:hypothetical protein